MKPKTLAILCVAALSRRLLESGDCPRLAAFAREKGWACVKPVLPALTLPMQATFMTGSPPAGHGAVGNGFFDRAWLEHRFWNASARLLERPPFWHDLAVGGRPVRAGALFWWHCLGGGLDTYLNVAPLHASDGRTIPSCYSDPPGLYPSLEAKLGPFPLHRFWGPGVSIESTAWILSATREVLESRNLDVLLAYLPHMDYSLQRSGPSSEEAVRHLRELDELMAPFLDRAEEGAYDVMILAEYGIVPVRGAVRLNRFLREADWFRVRTVQGRDYPDLPGSRAFAICDHQVAHLYMGADSDAAGLQRLARLLSQAEGVDAVLDGPGKAREGLDHPRSGDLVALSSPDRWFDYSWWDDRERAPDYADRIDIHRKIGYDPLELLPGPQPGRIARDLSLVRGSHGLRPTEGGDFPVLIPPRKALLEGLPSSIEGVKVRELLCKALAAAGFEE